MRPFKQSEELRRKRRLERRAKNGGVAHKLKTDNLGKSNLLDYEIGQLVRILERLQNEPKAPKPA